MARCSYCGKPAGLLRRQHAECRARLDSAMDMIPGFFGKVLQSQLTPERFGALLKDVAQGSFISPAAFKSICVAGIGKMVDSALRQGLLTRDEEQRILDIASKLGLEIADIPNSTNKMLQADILRELGRNKIPDRVSVVGPLLFDLQPNETVVWIFNRVISYRQVGVLAAQNTEADSSAQPMNTHYYSTDAVRSRPLRMDGLREEGKGDLVVTSHNIVVVLPDRTRKISLKRIVGLEPYVEGIQIIRDRAGTRPSTFVFNDPWFATNLIVNLIRISHAEVASSRYDDKPPARPSL